VNSRYVSANSQAVYLGSGGLAVEIVSLEANPIGASRAGLAVEVSWKTSLEDGVQGFYVERSFEADGEYQTVSDLLPANQEPSSYTYIDRIPASRDLRGVRGAFYRVVAVDIEDNRSIAGPVPVTLSELPSDPRMERSRSR
jgi:hypothetical protein